MDSNTIISVLGSTGSVGTQTLETAEHLGMRIAAISGGRNDRLLEEQIRRWKPSLCTVSDEAAGRRLQIAVADTSTRVLYGTDAALEAASCPDSTTVVAAISGFPGLKPTLAAIDAGKTIALANKEVLVAAGSIVMKRAQEKGVAVLPVDSEHAAIHQCLKGESRQGIKKILLTASGGPFAGKKLSEIADASPANALKHPNWSMGQKISIDSATMMNKGFEFIEAMHLFGLKPEEIEIIVHRESIIHSMVEFQDHAVVAQLGVADMRLPIQYALTYPNRMPSLAAELDLVKIGKLTFEKPDYDTFAPLRCALRAAKEGGTLASALDGANDACVALFLAGKIRLIELFEALEAALDAHQSVSDPSLDDIFAANEWADAFVHRRFEK